MDSEWIQFVENVAKTGHINLLLIRTETTSLDRRCLPSRLVRPDNSRPEDAYALGDLRRLLHSLTSRLLVGRRARLLLVKLLHLGSLITSIDDISLVIAVMLAENYLVSKWTFCAGLLGFAFIFTAFESGALIASIRGVGGTCSSD